MTVEFTKLHGAGNDYIAIDGRGIDRDWGALSKAMSALVSIDTSTIYSDVIVSGTM
jgi:diaminopimelate epimerase